MRMIFYSLFKLDGSVIMKDGKVVVRIYVRGGIVMILENCIYVENGVGFICIWDMICVLSKVDKSVFFLVVIYDMLLKRNILVEVVIILCFLKVLFLCMVFSLVI